MPVFDSFLPLEDFLDFPLMCCQSEVGVNVVDNVGESVGDDPLEPSNERGFNGKVAGSPVETLGGLSSCWELFEGIGVLSISRVNVGCRELSFTA